MAVVTPARGGPGPRGEVRRPPARRRWRDLGRGRAATVLLPVLGCLLLVVVWWVVVAAFAIQSYVLPTPPSVLSAFWQAHGDLLAQSAYTLLEVLEGYAMAVVVAALIALAVRASPIVGKAVYPLVLAFNSVPKIAVAPLLVVWLGYGTLPKAMMVFLICFFPIVISAVAGLASTPAELVDLGMSLEARPWKAFVKIRLPNALPEVFVGLKVAMTLAVIGAVVAEYQGSTTAGLGFVLTSSSGQGNTALAFAAVVMLSLMSILLYYSLVLLERLLLPWARDRNRNLAGSPA
ncbi:MAG: NitT/TauT family transport system permease protein [Micromonosporaceae bacterium]